MRREERKKIQGYRSWGFGGGRKDERKRSKVIGFRDRKKQGQRNEGREVLQEAEGKKEKPRL